MTDENTPIVERSFNWRIPAFGFVIVIAAALGLSFDDGKLSCAGDVDVSVEEGSTDAASEEDAGEESEASEQDTDSPEADTEAGDADSAADPALPAPEGSAEEGSGEGSGL